jgi:hypothetical protein
VPHIATVPPAQATGETAEVYAELRRMSGSGLGAAAVARLEHCHY